MASIVNKKRYLSNQIRSRALFGTIRKQNFTQMNAEPHIPVLTDTEAESSIELDVALQQLDQSETVNATKSVFNITLEQLEDDSESIKLSDQGYERRLQEESKEWCQLWRNELKNLQHLKTEKHPVVNSSLLSAGKRAYLEQAPDLQKFMRDSVDFRVAAGLFLENDFAVVQELEQNLIDVCEQRVNMAEEFIIQRNLACQPNHKAKEASK